MPKNPFAPGTPGRKCERCHRGGSVTMYLRRYLHPKCAVLEGKAGRLFDKANQKTTR